MKRRRRFTEFPMPPVTTAEAIQDTKNMDYLSKFRDHHVRTVFYLALLGMTEAQMAVALDISPSCFSQWKLKHETFSKAIREGKTQADAKVVYSLYQSAIGYEHDAEQVFLGHEKTYDPTSGKLVKDTPKIVRVPIRKQYPPNVKAAIKWLEIRQPEQWSSRTDQKSKLTLVQNNYSYTELTMEELKLLQKIGVQHNPPSEVGFQTTLQQGMKVLET